MTDLPPARHLLATAPNTPATHRVTLDYDARLMRRKRLITQSGGGFMVDLPQVTNLDAHWGFALENGDTVQIVAAEEPVVVITGTLPQLAWHIGNRHTPCQIEADSLIIRQDPVLERMLTGLGAQLRHETRAFTPEKGAYGHGRTMGHAHTDDMEHLHG